MGKLMTCPKCGRPVATSATSCIHCRYRIAETFSHLETEEVIQRKYKFAVADIEGGRAIREEKAKARIKRKEKVKNAISFVKENPTKIILIFLMVAIIVGIPVSLRLHTRNSYEIVDGIHLYMTKDSVLRDFPTGYGKGDGLHRIEPRRERDKGNLLDDRLSYVENIDLSFSEGVLFSYGRLEQAVFYIYYGNNESPYSNIKRVIRDFGLEGYEFERGTEEFGSRSYRTKINNCIEVIIYLEEDYTHRLSGYYDHGTGDSNDIVYVAIFR